MSTLQEVIVNGWTLKVLVVVSLFGLNRQAITVPYTLRFITEEINEDYYTGVATKLNYKLSK
jgi:hypothetical protein